MNFLRISPNDILSCIGKLVFSHQKKDDFGGAYELSQNCKITLEIPRKLGASELDLLIYDESVTEIKYSIPVSIHSFEPMLDKYVLSFPAKLLGCGLYFGKIKLKTHLGYLYAYKDNGILRFSFDEDSIAFQLSVSDFKYKAPESYYGGVIYHIFVDRFNRGGKPKKRCDAVYIDDWSSDIPEYPAYPGAYLENNTFYGGTLFGVIEKLDYIASLGVNLIYLSPIFEAYSNHKYDTGNYMKVDEMFGGDEALFKLVKEASKRGIGIILDGVFNHTGADSVYFNKFGKYDTVGAYQSKESDYYGWYDFKSFPDDYTCWWGIKILPRINPDISSCGDYFTEYNGVIQKYSDMGIAGFRLDVADELSDNFISKIKHRLDQSYGESLLYGEVWEDASNKIAYDKRKKYYLGSELDGVMNYPLRKAIISFLKFHDTAELHYLFNEILPNAPKRIRDAQMNLLGTHDTERILTVLGGESAAGKTNDCLKNIRMSKAEYELAKKRLKLAYTLSLTLPGIPAIFYGDEAGIEGYSDPFNRRTFPWDKEDKDILSFYVRAGKIRRSYEVYKKGDFKLLHLSSDLLIFKRFDKRSVLLTVINNSQRTLKLRFTKEAKALLQNSTDKVIKVDPFKSEIIDTSASSFNFAFMTERTQ